MEKPIPEYILRWDYRTWFYLNVAHRSPLLDFFIPFVRNQFFWAPVYLFLLVFMVMNFGKRGIVWCMAFLLTFALCDYTCGTVLKHYFQRVRPCNNELLRQVVILIVPRSFGYSFPSNHAANHFGLSIFISLTLGRVNRWVWVPAMLWAALVAYAQVYVGVHFPLDVVCGALLGSWWGMLMARIFNKTIGLSKDIKTAAINPATAVPVN